MSVGAFFLDRWADRISAALEQLKANPVLAAAITAQIDAFFVANPKAKRDLESEAVLSVIFVEADQPEGEGK